MTSVTHEFLGAAGPLVVQSATVFAEKL